MRRESQLMRPRAAFEDSAERLAAVRRKAIAERNGCSDQLEQFISASDVARLLGWRTATLRKYRKQGKGPRGYIPTGKTRGVYPVAAVIEYQRQMKKGG